MALLPISRAPLTSHHLPPLHTHWTLEFRVSTSYEHSIPLHYYHLRNDCHTFFDIPQRSSFHLSSPPSPSHRRCPCHLHLLQHHHHNHNNTNKHSIHPNHRNRNHHPPQTPLLPPHPPQPLHLSLHNNLPPIRRPIRRNLPAARIRSARPRRPRPTPLIPRRREVRRRTQNHQLLRLGNVRRLPHAMPFHAVAFATHLPRPESMGAGMRTAVGFTCWVEREGGV